MFVHNVLVAAICIKLVYYVYAMLSLCLLSHGLNRVEGKLFKSGQNGKTDPLRVAVMQAASLFSLVSVATKKQNF